MPLASPHGGIDHASLSNAREPWYRLCSRMWTLLASTCMAGSWIPAFAENTPQKHPSHGSKVLGGLEEHLASWTKGCEGQKGSGGSPLGLNKSPRGEGRRERISSLVA